MYGTMKQQEKKAKYEEKRRADPSHETKQLCVHKKGTRENMGQECNRPMGNRQKDEETGVTWTRNRYRDMYNGRARPNRVEGTQGIVEKKQ